MLNEERQPNEDFEADIAPSLTRLNKDLLKSAKLLGRNSIRYLTDTYYQVQHFRIVAANQLRSQVGEPNQLLTWVFNSYRLMENDIKKALGEFAEEYTVGRWLQSIYGIGPVLSAGFIARLDISKARMPSHFIRYSGMDPTRIWHGKAGSKKICDAALGADFKASQKLTNENLETIGKLAGWTAKEFTTKIGLEITRKAIQTKLAKCPWNPEMKLLMFKAGSCFVKFCNKPDDIYGKLYLQRKQEEDIRNEAGGFAETVRLILEKKTFGAETASAKAYKEGKMPSCHLFARARRYACTIFLNHIHSVMYEDYFGEPCPRPYALEKLQGNHRHYIPIPNYPLTKGMKAKSLRELLD